MSELPYPFIDIGIVVGTWDTTAHVYPDTGFEGGLMIPAGVGREILASPSEAPYLLPGRYRIVVPVWRGKVTVEDRVFDADIVAYGDRFLLGREVLDNIEVCFAFGRELHLRLEESANGR
jgi:hypothetical protein